MPCYKPLQGWRSRYINESGKRSIVFNRADAYADMPIEVPCGQCIGCRLERSRQWAMRCVHEASLHQDNCFLTLTYDPEQLPPGGSLSHRHLQLFFKRLRKRFSHIKMRYFACGEYGDMTDRAHYHVLLFGFDFPDKVLFAERSGNRVFVSQILNEVWGHGMTEIGSVTFESAAYVARYIVKKQKISDDSPQHVKDHYKRVIPETGEIIERLPEFVRMSLKPAIGKCWLEKFESDVFPSDEIIVRGRSMKPPKFYSVVLEKKNPELYAQLRGLRVRQAKKHSADSTPVRLRVRELVKIAQVKALKRSL